MGRNDESIISSRLPSPGGPVLVKLSAEAALLHHDLQALLQAICDLVEVSKGAVAELKAAREAGAVLPDAMEGTS